MFLEVYGPETPAASSTKAAYILLSLGSAIGLVHSLTTRSLSKAVSTECPFCARADGMPQLLDFRAGNSPFAVKTT